MNNARKVLLAVLAHVLEEVAGKWQVSERFYGLCRTANMIRVYRENRMYKHSTNTTLSICKTATCFDYICSHHQAEHRTIIKKKLSYSTIRFRDEI